jgi:RNA 3'-terminal phosphate cyclase
MIEIDGSLGEGGGQVLRSSLALSMLTRLPVHLTHIRARRPKPGLQAQHLAAVKAAAAISAAQVDGAALNSQELTFTPGDVRSDDYRFDIGTAGSTSLVLQTIFLPLALANRLLKAEAAPTPPTSRVLGADPDPEITVSSEVTLIGGTHVSWSPCFHYLDLQWLPYLRRMGIDATLELLLAGFYPQGNGQVRARIAPVREIAPLQLPERGALKGIRGISAVANLDMAIAERQRNQALQRLKGRHSKIDIELVELPARTKGTFLLLLAEFRHASACFVGLGALGKRAEQVADEACLWLEKFLAGTGAIDEYLADQLLLPLAFASGESKFRTAQVTPHLLTNAEVIRAFGVAEIEIGREHGKEGNVRVMPAI